MLDTLSFMLYINCGTTQGLYVLGVSFKMNACTFFGDMNVVQRVGDGVSYSTYHRFA
jgi:hypothetical protein